MARINQIPTTLGVCFLLSIALAVQSCEDFLDTNPGFALPLSTGLDNAEALEDFLIGTYDMLQFNVDLLQIGLVDIMTEDTGRGGQCGEGSGLDEFCFNDIGPDNQWLSWNGPYAVINQANIIIERVEALLEQEEIDVEQANSLSGEAYFLRGLMYFELIRLYALPLHKGSELGVPIITEGVDNTDKLTFPSRASVEDVYNQIIEDFTNVTQLLPVSRGENGRASYFSAVAYLTEVAFQNAQVPQDFTEVVEKAKMLIESGEYSLTDTPENYFRNKGTTEDIFSVFHSNQEVGDLWVVTLSNFTFAAAFRIFWPLLTSIIFRMTFVNRLLNICRINTLGVIN